MRCGMALGGVDTLGSVDTLGGVDTLGSGSRGDCCGAAVSSNTSCVGVAFWKWLTRKAGSGVRGTDDGNGGGDQAGALGASCSLSSSSSA